MKTLLDRCLSPGLVVNLHTVLNTVSGEGIILALAYHCVESFVVNS